MEHKNDGCAVGETVTVIDVYVRDGRVYGFTDEDGKPVKVKEAAHA